MHLHFVNDILCMCWWWEHNVRKKTLKTYLHTFQNGGYLKSVVSTSTETSGQMKIVIDIKPFCKCHRELKNILLIKIGHKKPNLWLFSVRNSLSMFHSCIIHGQNEKLLYASINNWRWFITRNTHRLVVLF